MHQEPHKIQVGSKAPTGRCPLPQTWPAKPQPALRPSSKCLGDRHYPALLGPEVHAGTVHCDTASRLLEAEEKGCLWAGQTPHNVSARVDCPLPGLARGRCPGTASLQLVEPRTSGTTESRGQGWGQKIQIMSGFVFNVIRSTHCLKISQDPSCPPRELVPI